MAGGAAGNVCSSAVGIILRARWLPGYPVRCRSCLCDDPPIYRMKCSQWCGMPAMPARPLHCGVVVYLHIPKTGGSSVAQSLLQHSTGGRGWWQASVTGNSTWSSIVAKLRQRTRPKQIIIHHVDSPTALSSVAQLIKPLDCWLRSQHCRLVLTTTLRDAATRATSAAYCNAGRSSKAHLVRGRFGVRGRVGVRVRRTW